MVRVKDTEERTLALSPESWFEMVVVQMTDCCQVCVSVSAVFIFNVSATD